jgi:hypothetical protein
MSASMLMSVDVLSSAYHTKRYTLILRYPKQWHGIYQCRSPTPIP